MNKKAQGVSITVIIIAAIALIVLVILIAIFTGRIGLWGQGLDKGIEKKNCAPDNEWKESDKCTTSIVYGFFDDEQQNPGKVCCKKT